MTVLERCAEVRERLERHTQLKLAIKNAKVFRARADEVRDAANALEVAQKKWRILSESGVSIEPMPDGEALLALVSEFLEKPDQADADAGKDYGRVKQALGRYSKGLSETVGKALSALTKSAPSVDEAFLRRVEAIPKYAATVAKIRQERQTLLAGMTPTEMSPEVLQRFMERRETFRQLLGTLNVEEFPKDVLDFFAAARRDAGAPYAKFTSTVVSWLETQGMIDHVRIKISES